MFGKKRDDNFSDSSMSFTEHLDQLRYHLIHSIYWLAGAFVFALIPWGDFGSLSGWVVSCIQRPLSKALEDYYVNLSSERLKGQASYLEQLGYSRDIALVPRKLGMTEREIWLFPEDIARLKKLLNNGTDTEPPVPDDFSAPDDSHRLSRLQVLEMVDNYDRFKNGSGFASAGLAGSSMKPVPFLCWEKLSDDPRTRAKSLSMPETFVIFLKAAFLVAAILASPGIFYHFWAFVGAGLYAKERRFVYRFLPFSLTLFFAGAALAFFVVFQFVLSYLLTFNSGMNIDPDPRISEWLKLAIGLPLGFGIGFQLPLVMFALYRIQIFTVQSYVSQWRVSVLVIAVCAMMLTPPDPGSMFCMMIPLISLYFLGIGLCKLWPLPKGEFDEIEGD